MSPSATLAIDLPFAWQAWPLVLVECHQMLCEASIIQLDDGWPESVEEQGLLLLEWRRNFRNDL